MKFKMIAVVAMLILPSLAMAQFRGGGYGRGFGGYHGGYGGGYHGYDGFRGYDRGYRGGHSSFDFSFGIGGYYPSYGYATYAPPVVYSSPAPVVSYGSYDYYGGAYYGSPVIVAPAPIVTRSYVAPLPPITYSRSYDCVPYAPRYDFSARYYYRH